MRLLPLLLATACGESSNTGAACDPTADTCTGSDICLANVCEPAFPLTYEAFQIHAATPEAHDLQVAIAVAGRGDPPAIVARSAVVTGSEVDFAESLRVDIGAQTDALLVELLDATTGDQLLACARSPIDMDRLRRRDDNCDKEGYWLSYEFVPAIASADDRR